MSSDGSNELALQRQASWRSVGSIANSDFARKFTIGNADARSSRSHRTSFDLVSRQKSSVEWILSVALPDRWYPLGIIRYVFIGELWKAKKQLFMIERASGVAKLLFQTIVQNLFSDNKGGSAQNWSGPKASNEDRKRVEVCPNHR